MAQLCCWNEQWSLTLLTHHLMTPAFRPVGPTRDTGQSTLASESLSTHVSPVIAASHTSTAASLTSHLPPSLGSHIIKTSCWMQCNHEKKNKTKTWICEHMEPISQMKILNAVLQSLKSASGCCFIHIYIFYTFIHNYTFSQVLNAS